MTLKVHCKTKIEIDENEKPKDILKMYPPPK